MTKEPIIFIDKLKQIVSDCFSSLKDKKRNHINEQKTLGLLLETFRSLKCFKSTDNIFSNLKSLGAYHKKKDTFIKIISIDLIENCIEGYDFTNGNRVILQFRDLILFDSDSIQFDVIYKQYLDNGGVLHSTQIYHALKEKKMTQQYRIRKEEIKFGN